MDPVITIDGAHGEGGGQVIRTALSLSAITGKAVEVVNVRAGRTKQGLQPQHLASVRAAATLCAARLEGDAAGSPRFLFAPQTPVQPGTYRFDIGTAGAASLVAQTVLLPLALAGGPSRVTITGGTHVPHSPPADYLELVYLPALRRAGLTAASATARAGFFPKGGGEVTLDVEPVAVLAPLDITRRGPLESLTACVVTSGLPPQVAARGAAAVEKAMKAIGRRASVEMRDRPSPGEGAAVMLFAHCEDGHAGFSAIGERGRPMEGVAQEVCDAFLTWWKSGAACDERLADQLVLPLALAGGTSRWTTPRLTRHLHTALWVTRHFLPIEFSLEEHDGMGVVTLTAA